MIGVYLPLQTAPEKHYHEEKKRIISAHHYLSQSQNLLF